MLRHRAWIKLALLPFECWFEAGVSSLVGSFGRYLCGDEDRLNILDLSSFRCQVAVDELAAIPEFISVSLGDHSFPVAVQIESSSPIGGVDRSAPCAGRDPVEGVDLADHLGRRLARRDSLPGGGTSPNEVQVDTGNSSENFGIDGVNVCFLARRAAVLDGPPAQLRCGGRRELAVMMLLHL